MHCAPPMPVSGSPQACEVVYQALIDAELTAKIGAAAHERTQTRTNQRNGSRRAPCPPSPGTWVADPQAAQRVVLPALLERRRRVDQCLFAVVMEAYLHGTSTRKVDDLVRPSAPIAGSPKARCPGSARTSTPRSPPSATGRWVSSASLCVPRCHPAGPGQPPRGLPGGGHRHRSRRRRPPRGAGL